MSGILNERVLARRERPIRLTKRLYLSGKDGRRDQRITYRYRDLLSLHRKWGYTCSRVLKTKKLRRISKAWSQYAQEDLQLNASQRSLSHDAQKMHYLEGLNNGFAVDVRSVHNARHLWYFEKLPYQMDCTLMLIKLLNNMRWCRDQDKPHLMNEEPGFPLMNYEMEYGPTFPCQGDVFGQRDKQMVVHDGQCLIYFEVGYTGLHEGRVVSVYLE